MSDSKDISLFRKQFLQKLRTSSAQKSQVDVQDDSAVQKSVDPKALIGPHEPDMNPRVEVHADQGSEEANQTPECGSSESKSDEVSDHQSQQSGDESEESDNELRIEDFPNEILEKILSNLSGINLLRCRTVNRRWNLTVQHILNVQGSAKTRNRRWREICTQIIPENVLIETIQRKFAGPTLDLAIRDEIDWREIWKGLQSCRADPALRIDVKKFTIKTRVTLETVIQVIASDELLIMNHPSGRLTFWNSTTEQLGDVIALSATCNLGCITLGDFFRTGPYDLGLSCSANHHFVVAGTHNGQISVHALAMDDYVNGFHPIRETVLLPLVHGEFSNINIFDDLIIAALRTTTIIIWKMSPPHPDHPGSKLPSIVTHRTITPPSFLSSIVLNQTAVWPILQNHELMSITSVSVTTQRLSGTLDGGGWKECSEWKMVRPLNGEDELFHPRQILICQEPNVMSSITDGATSIDDFIPKFCLRMIECNRGEKVRLLGLPTGQRLSSSTDRALKQVALQAFMFHDDLTVMFSQSRMLLISVDGKHYRCYDTVLSFGSHVTAVTYHAGLLLLGTYFGRVFAFKPKQMLDFLMLDLFAPTWSEVLSEEKKAVQSLHISHSGRRVCLTAAFEYSVTCLTWTTEDNEMSV